MSSNAYPVIWAMKHAPVADALERLILIAMADAGDSDGCNSYRSFRSHMLIAKDVDESTIRRRQRAMADRGLIRPDTTPPPSRYLAIPKNRRPPRWEICIPYSWWSDAQREEIQRERQDKGLPEITPESRPDLPDAPPRKPRADKGKPNPKRGRKKATPGAADQGGRARGVSETPRSVTPGVSTRQPQGCLQDSPRGVSETPNLPVVTFLDHPPEKTARDRSSRSAQLGDARASATAPQAANEGTTEDLNGAGSGEDGPGTRSERPQSAEGARGDQRAAPLADRPSGRRSASQEARRVLGALPRVFRDGAKPWVLAAMAVRIDAMLADGRSPGAIVRAAEEIAVARPIGDRDHIDALHAVRAALRTNAFDRQAADDADRCDGCGARRTGAVPCVTCDPVEVLDVIDLDDVAEG